MERSSLEGGIVDTTHFSFGNRQMLDLQDEVRELKDENERMSNLNQRLLTKNSLLTEEIAALKSTLNQIKESESNHESLQKSALLHKEEKEALLAQMQQLQEVFLNAEKQLSLHKKELWETKAQLEGDTRTLSAEAKNRERELVTLRREGSLLKQRIATLQSELVTKERDELQHGLLLEKYRIAQRMMDDLVQENSRLLIVAQRAQKSEEE